jgi:hypothetical protein
MRTQVSHSLGSSPDWWHNCRVALGALGALGAPGSPERHASTSPAFLLLVESQE